MPHGFCNSRKVCVIAVIKHKTAAFVWGANVSHGVFCVRVCMCVGPSDWLAHRLLTDLTVLLRPVASIKVLPKYNVAKKQSE